MWAVIEGDCIAKMSEVGDDQFDSIVTDPPYGLEFMGKAWDKYTPGEFQHWCEQWAREALRILKPGGYLVAFGGTRTYHRLAAGIEDAGFEIRDSLHWIYGSGFPKSMDVSKAIDKVAGAERKPSGVPTSLACEFVRRGEPCKGHGDGIETSQSGSTIHALPTAPATAAKQWAGWGTALKPSHEPIILARKPLSNKTVAANVLEHGTGGLNIDGCRVAGKPWTAHDATGLSSVKFFTEGETPVIHKEPHGEGRWPPNMLLTHTPWCVPTGETRKVRTAYRPDNVEVGSPDKDVYGKGLNQRMSPAHGDPDGTETLTVWECTDDCPVAEMDRQSGTLTSGTGAVKRATAKGHSSSSIGVESRPTGTPMISYGDTGGASRFFPCFRYQAKASKKERPPVDGVSHPTVKPLALMRWLVKLVTPPGGTVADLFAGTGPVAEAAELEGFDCVLFEREPEYVELINLRMRKYQEDAA